MREKGFANMVVIVLVIVLMGALGYVSLVNKPAPVGQQIDNLENEQPLIKPALPSPSEPPASPDSEEIVMNCNVFNRPSCLASKFYCKWVSNPSGSCIYKPISNRCGDIISKEICLAHSNCGWSNERCNQFINIVDPSGGGCTSLKAEDCDRALACMLEGQCESL